MKKIIITIMVLITLIGSQTVSAAKYTSGYYKKNGTYVTGHYKSDPNRYRFDNYSSKGNSNPFTGKKGYKKY